jgi:DNA-directed RNA polymerase beta' subunit
VYELHVDVRPSLAPIRDLVSTPLEVASAARIRELSFGEVKRPDLLNHKTGLPEPGGLMCARIFGTTKDYECLCGKYAHARGDWIALCEKCGVFLTSASVRATQMGRVELAMPVLHPWLAPLAATLDDPAPLMMTVLPVMPPALRPVGADINDLYQRVINRNNRLRRLEELNAPDDILQNERRMLREAVAQLFDNENVEPKVIDESKRPLRSLGAMTISALQASFADRTHLLWMGFVPAE